MEFNKTLFLNKKEGQAGEYYAGKLGDKFVNVFHTKDGALKIKIGNDVHFANPVKSGKGFICTIDDETYFLGTGVSKIGEYMKFAKLPPRDNNGDTQQAAPKQEYKKQEYKKPAANTTKAYGGRTFKS